MVRPWSACPALTRLALLKEVCVWQLDYNAQLVRHIGDLQPADMRLAPLGQCASGDSIWSVDPPGVASAWLFRCRVDSAGEHWDTVSSTLDEFEAFQASLCNDDDADDDDGRQRQLAAVLRDGVLPRLQRLHKKAQAAERRLTKMANATDDLSLANIVPSGSRSRKRVNYDSKSFDSLFDDLE
eukprot:TRINITY_DN1493_c0_g1_i1.p3 TRINITY_DN1493_c0_g1~~TRINITY_DN1493_c0_g1_i1.p3  ORF type:complete len:183 (-),score=50.93 TRINITY_DN1493_c0_g1_i1:24-572(-)